MTDQSATAQDPQNAVLARIVAAHRREAVAARDRTAVLSNAWSRTLRHASRPFEGLDLSPSEVAVSEHANLSTVLAALPEHGLVAALEDRDGRRGLIALSNGIVDALVEVQTTGRVEPRAHLPRTVTRIDEALSRDFIDFCLGALSKETEPIQDRDWPRRMTYGSHIADRRQLTLLMPEVSYHLLSAKCALGQGGDREGQGVIILPSDADLVEGQPTPPDGRSLGAAPEEWREVIAALLADAEIPLQAVLMRMKRSLRDVNALADGALIDFSHDELSSVDLQTPGGKHVLTGRLGQIGGKRALRITRTGIPADTGTRLGDPAAAAGLGALGSAEAAALPSDRGVGHLPDPANPPAPGADPLPGAMSAPMPGRGPDGADPGEGMAPGPGAMPMGMPTDLPGGPAPLLDLPEPGAPDLPELDPAPMSVLGTDAPQVHGDLPPLGADAPDFAPAAMPLEDPPGEAGASAPDPLGFAPQTAPLNLDDLPK